MQERRQTKQRAALLEALAHAEEPLSAEQLFLKLQPQFPRLALSTVYRNVERMVEEGALQKELTEDGVFLYGLQDRHGHYLICLNCQKKVRLTHCPLESVEKQLSEETGFSIESHNLTLYGTCPSCRAKEKSNEKE